LAVQSICEKIAVISSSPLLRWIPAFTWLRAYDRSWLRGDVLAGVTLAAYLLPAALGDASLANLPPEAGLYACLFGGLVFWIFCGSRYMMRKPGGCGCTCRCSCSPAWSRAPRVAVIRCCKIRPNSRCAGSDDYAGYMLARHIKPKKIVFHSRLLPHETCRMNRVQHLKTKKGFLVFSDSGFMTYQPQT
jgi:hypothetical protein